MPNPKTAKPGRPHLARDRQQWIFDYVIQQSHMVYHWWSGGEATLPESVRSHAMISKHIGREAIALEQKAAAARDAGQRDEALKLYFAATTKYMRAQHTVFENNGEKLFLYGGLRRCFEQVCELSPYRIERVQVPFEGSFVSGYLHLCPDVGTAPLYFSVPGCDVTGESWPDPRKNPVHARGMHLFSFDGPGLGQSNINGIKLTATNFEVAASAMIDELIKRPEIDADKIVVAGSGAGSPWSLRIAAHDHRIKAAATKNSYAEKYYLMNEDGPRWKQLFAYLTQSVTEAELDEMIEAFTLNGYMERIECPTLMIAGEYDHRDPIEEVYEVFDQLRAPSELWVFADCFLKVSIDNGPSVGDRSLDWLVDRLAGVPLAHPGEVQYIEPGDPGPNMPGVQLKRRWYEESR